MYIFLLKNGPEETTFIVHTLRMGKNNPNNKDRQGVISLGKAELLCRKHFSKTNFKIVDRVNTEENRNRKFFLRSIIRGAIILRKYKTKDGEMAAVSMPDMLTAANNKPKVEI